MPQIEGSQILDFGKIRSVLTDILHARITQHFLGGSPFYQPNPITQRQIFWRLPTLAPFACLPGQPTLAPFWYIWLKFQISDFGHLYFFYFSDFLNIFSYRADTSIPITFVAICVVDSNPGAYLSYETTHES